MVLGELDSNIQNNDTGPLSYTIHKNSKWMKDLNVSQEAIKTPGNNLFDLSHSNLLLDTSPKARELKAKMNYWDITRQKPSAQQRKQSTKLKGN